MSRKSLIAIALLYVLLYTFPEVFPKLHANAYETLEYEVQSEEEVTSSNMQPMPQLEKAIRNHPALQEALELAENSGILESLRHNSLPPPITLFLPSNEAVSAISKENKDFLLKEENRDILDSLMLFSALDFEISYEEIKRGAYKKQDSIITLLSEGISISEDGELCASSGQDCVQIIDHVEVPGDGSVFVINSILYPSEVLDLLPVRLE
ncbi:hypothetical protein IE077_002869 [Cardiosporidium cionae]|uniref:FAS1 domain-containing protein n=1 Tax=Cardiosporidium cionae TaxID=476202 RepID=A0ABQ7JAN9_9APIC|nr:hypothetical protein IE077_002869 [Cardiosporidium cionae]|eukprot:KAF8820720.1 hypothetical protein IE077_002869 [Cardiosporidium cionae]